MNDSSLERGPRGVRIIGLAGSLRGKSHTRRAVEIALAGASDAGADAALVDLRELQLPFCSGSDEALQKFPDVARLRSEVRAAHGIILGTPEYHGSFSGVLKNALDLTDPDDWRGRVIALVGISGGSSGPGSALAALRSVGRGLAAWVLPSQVSISSSFKAFDEAGEPHDADVAKRLKKLGAELVEFSQWHAEKRRDR